MSPQGILKFVFLAILATSFLGCAAAPPIQTVSLATESLPGDIYYPKLKPSITSLDNAKNNLAELVRRNPGIKFYYPQGINKPENKDALFALVKGGSDKCDLYYNSRDELLYMLLSRVSVLTDRIGVSPQIELRFTDLIPATIVVETFSNQEVWVATVIRNEITNPSTLDYSKRPYVTRVPGLMSFHFVSYDDATNFADNLYSIQQALKNKKTEQDIVFAEKAAEYRAMKVKPSVSEGQRKYIVQADAMSQQKEYKRAIDFYLKALEIDPTSYPGAYFNLALLSSQLQWYNEAISYMKQYLQLEPDAKDSRSAQDKIYVWEALQGK